ncbi:hypothetical protein [Streptomyces sp. NPDC054834]
MRAYGFAYGPPTVVPSAEAAEVHRRFEAGGTRGKTVLEIGGPGAA